eukprot:superscaffoldBa00006949_g22065
MMMMEASMSAHIYSVHSLLKGFFLSLRTNVWHPSCCIYLAALPRSVDSRVSDRKWASEHKYSTTQETCMEGDSNFCLQLMEKFI